MDIKIKTKHIIMFSSLVSKMGLNFDAKGKTQEELGADLVYGLIQNLHKASDEFYDLISDITNIKDVEDLEIKELIVTLQDLFKEMLVFFKPQPKE